MGTEQRFAVHHEKSNAIAPFHTDFSETACELLNSLVKLPVSETSFSVYDGRTIRKQLGAAVEKRDWRERLIIDCHAQRKPGVSYDDESTARSAA